MDEFLLDDLFNCLTKGVCLLVIGPDMFRYNGLPLSEALSQHLRVGQNPDIALYDARDELFTFKGTNENLLKAAQNKVYRRIKDFYEGLQPDELHEQIARLPFPVIINFTPDLLLSYAFDKAGLPHEFRFYNKRNARDPLETSAEHDAEETTPPTPDYPLLYNFTGRINDEHSLILTYSDLFEFLFNVFGRNNLPQSLRNVLEIQDGIDDSDRKDFLFLGFQFNKWYLQMFLRLLHTQVGNQRYAFNPVIAPPEKPGEQPDYGFMYLSNYFSLDARELDPRELIRELYARCEREGKLRQPGQAPEKNVAQSQLRPFHMQLEDLLAQNKVRPLIQLLRQHFADTGDDDSRQQVLTVSARYETLLSSEVRGLVYSEHARVERSHVYNFLSQMIEAIRKKALQPAAA